MLYKVSFITALHLTDISLKAPNVKTVVEKYMFLFLF